MYSSPTVSSRPATPQATQNLVGQAERSQAIPQCRLMQVKVLYTFDDNNRTHCLARCPQPLLIRTALLDASSEIGIIELRTCVQAIVAASPELIAKLGQDYTVYAYDYSEYETPLVGQGMLSWVLASASATPTAPAHQSRTMVTGRVCKNIFGLFSDGIKETLEVKLRLVPVPTCLQSEYLASMAKYRDASNLATEGLDVDAWTTFIRANPGFSTVVPMLDVPFPATIQEHANRGKGNIASETACNISGSKLLYGNVSECGQSCAKTIDSELQTPHDQGSENVGQRAQTLSYQSQNKRTAPSRPSSRTSSRGNQTAKVSVMSRAGSQREKGAVVGEEGPSRKRIRTTKADWQGPSSFAPNVESLRVTASTAASIRGHSLSRIHPTASELVAGEFGKRPPTPRPLSAAQRKQPDLVRRSTALSSDMIQRPSDDYTSPYPKDSGQCALTSPYGPVSSVESTPVNMPSSPPIPRPRSRSFSSPALPKFPQELDSGYTSGPMDEYSVQDDGGDNGLDEGDGDDEADDDIQPLDEEGTQVAAHHRGYTVSTTQRENSIPILIAADQSLQNRTISSLSQPLASSTAGEGAAIQCPNVSITTSTNNHVQAGSCDRQSRNSFSKERLIPSPCHTPPSLPLQRSESWQYGSVLVTDTPSSLGLVKLSNKQTTGTSLKRKKAIQERLHLSIAAGEMPPFCRNCGEISTPTWRKAFTKVEVGCPDDLGEQDEGFVMWEPMSKGADGMVASFRIIRKSISADDKEFEEIQLCNPCGIWLFKNRAMRPPEKWTKVGPEPSKPKRRSSKRPSTLAGSECQAGYTTEPASLAEYEVDGEATDLATTQVTRPLVTVTGSNSLRTADLNAGRSTSTNSFLGDDAALAALQKAIRSSPPRFPGSKQSPIDLEADISPRSTRRLLFPSPRQPGEDKLLDGPSIGSSNGIACAGVDRACTSNLVAEDKENNMPIEDDNTNLLNHSHDATEHLRSPHTPKSIRSSRTSSKTPTTNIRKRALAFNPFLSPSRRSISAPITPSRLLMLDGMEQMTPFTAQLTQLMSESNIPIAGDITGLDLFSDHLDDDVFGLQSFTDHNVEHTSIEGSSQHAMFSFHEDSRDTIAGPSD